jgi:CDP-6-deoxy-D-xylo-4-hexulose-3-dehydrase
MSKKLEQILSLVSDYIRDKRKNETWTPGSDWVSYSGPHYDEEEYVAAVKSILGEWLVFGQDCRDFEVQFPNLLGSQMGILTNSGSSANLLMVSALASHRSDLKKYHLPKGSKFITPVVCFPTTLNPLLQNGYEPVFVDVTLPDLNLDLDQVEEALKQDSSIKGIIFAHVLGNPPDMDRVMHLVEEYDLIFLEDCCDALGSTYKGKKLGSFGTMSTCSFYPAHHMTMAEGGFVATDSYILYKALASLRDWGRGCYCNEKKPGDVTSGTACGNRFKNWLCGRSDILYDHRYVYDEVGYNLKPIELQGAIGKQQLKKLPAMEAARRSNFKKLYDIFKPYEKYLWLNSATPGADPCWFGFLFTIKPESPFKREQLVNFLEENKIQTRPYFAGNILYHPAYKHIRGKEGDIKLKYPNADLVTLHSAFLGTYIGYTDEKILYIKEKIDEFFKELQ